MNFSPFYIATLPRIAFGEGEFSRLPEFLSEFGKRLLLVTGANSLQATKHWSDLLKQLKENAFTFEHFIVDEEPSPALIDSAVNRFKDANIEFVVAIGGGSVMDTGKAIAGLLPTGDSVMNFLEDVGKGLPYHGPSLPFIAVPTTAGTGSEATKNSVLSEHGTQGYKKSFRHECLVAKLTVVDPALMEACPGHLIAAQGMDAFTQLLESYVSLRANPLTDALAWSGLQAVFSGFLDAYHGGDTETARHGRAAMAYAALLSGITLAQVGLGSVHGLAQPLGSLFPIPHGVACGTTVATATSVNIQALRQRAPDSSALNKYAATGRLLADNIELNDTDACHKLVEVLEHWTQTLQIPRLSKYGVSENDIPKIVANSRGNSMKSNPVELSDAEIGSIVQGRL